MKGVEREVELFAIVPGNEDVANLHGGVTFLSKVIDGVEVAE